MKIVYKLAFASLIAVALVIIFFKSSEESNYLVQGEKLITLIEGFKDKQNRLPDSVAELGLEEQMGEGPYYKKIDNLYYIVYFNIGFDNFKTYSSATNEWKDGP